MAKEKIVVGDGRPRTGDAIREYSDAATQKVREANGTDFTISDVYQSTADYEMGKTMQSESPSADKHAVSHTRQHLGNGVYIDHYVSSGGSRTDIAGDVRRDMRTQDDDEGVFSETPLND